MKVEYFQEFVVLAEYLNYSTAAAHLYIAQPVLSRHIAALEKELGVRLFYRDTQNVSLTPSGRTFYKKITHILNEYEDLQALLRLQSEGFEGRLCVGVPYYALSDYLGRVPEQFEHAWPQYKLTYEVGSPDTILTYLDQDRCDVAILPHLPFPKHSHFLFRDFYEEPLGILVNSEDPLASMSSATIDMLRSYRFFQIAGTYFSITWDHLRSLCRDAGFDPVFSKVNMMESALIAVRRGDGIVIAGHHMRSQASNGISYVPLRGNNVMRRIAICYKAEKASEPCIQKFLPFF